MQKPITIKGDSVHFGKTGKILLRKFPPKFTDALKSFTEYDTLALEKEGAQLIKRGFGNAETSRFFDNVLQWAGKTAKAFVVPQITRFESRDAIIKSIPKAVKYLHSDEMRAAMEEMIFPKPKGLSISYGSKVLRMLSPQKVGVYDSVLNDELPYAYSIPGWIKFCRDCQIVAAELEKHGIKNLARKKGEWYVADVEAVIYNEMRK